MPAKQAVFVARPAGFEPATRGLEVLGQALLVVAGGCRISRNKPNYHFSRFPMFHVVALG
jgi:hypothetical protein